MFETLPVAPPDSILGLSDEFQKDTRKEKVNLTVGVFKDDLGQTPVLASVKAAEAKILDSEKSKGYLGIEGLVAYNTAVTQLALGKLFPSERVATLQSPGGTGALRIAGDVAANFSMTKRIWVSDPTWANHTAIFTAAGLEVKVYPYLSSDRVSADIEATIEHLEKHAQVGDLICLHACCHNPTGIDPSGVQWESLATSISKLRMIPLIDFAYQGFGDGLPNDRFAVEHLLSMCPEAIVCASFSKNFGLYSERTGAAMFICADEAAAIATLSQAKQVVRSNYSNPPRHGAAIVAEILNDVELCEQWQGEVDAMRSRIDRMRKSFVAGMSESGCDQDFSFLNKQKGMFSYSGLSKDHAAWLKTNRAIYILGTGRINVAGMSDKTMDYLCTSLAQCIADVSQPSTK